MRDPNRIRPFCMYLAELWCTAPDLRFGQLVTCALGSDPFYIEDEEALQLMERFFCIKEDVDD